MDIDDLLEHIKDIPKRAKEEYPKAIRAAAAEATCQYIPIASYEIEKIFRNVVDEFYSDYSPHEYDRSKSLYNIFSINSAEDWFEVSLSPSNMTGFRNGYHGEDGLYDQVFHLGWHGGAGSGKGHPFPGTPYWRYPTPYYTYWGDPAEIASISPFDDFVFRARRYWEDGSDFRELYRKIRDEYISNVKL